MKLTNKYHYISGKQVTDAQTGTRFYDFQGINDIDEENEGYDIVTNLSCPQCHCHVEVYHPSEKLKKEHKDYEIN